MDGCRFAYLTDSIQFKSDESNFVRGLFFFWWETKLGGGGGGGGGIVFLGLFMLVLGFVICNLPKIRKTGQWSLAILDN